CEIQSSFASITSNDQGFTVDRNMNEFLVTENFDMILGQPVHTDDNLDGEIRLPSSGSQSGDSTSLSEVFEFNPGASLGSGFLLALSTFAMVAAYVSRAVATLPTTSCLMAA
nr:hypothetical protein [Tanacetum cinerariifolium]